MTVGPWRPITLHAFGSTIDDLRATVDVKEDFSVNFDVSFGVKGSTDSLKAVTTLLSDDGKELLESTASLNGSRGTASFEAKSGELELWYPVGYGTQTLYTLQVKILDEVSAYIRPDTLADLDGLS